MTTDPRFKGVKIVVLEEASMQASISQSTDFWKEAFEVERFFFFQKEYVENKGDSTS